jgi:hypothetical protein
MKVIGKDPKTGKDMWKGKKWSHGTYRAKRHPNSKYVLDSREK